MKKLRQVFIAVLALSATLTGCKKDDDNSVKNYFKVGDTEYELAAGTIFGWEQTNVTGVYYVDLFLYSNGLSMDNMTMLSGKGNYLRFQMYSSSLTELPDGSYTYGLGTNKVATVFYMANVGIDYDANKDTSGVYISLSAGTVTIKKSGSEYEITISCTGEKGEAITGSYKGRLTKMNN